MKLNNFRGLPIKNYLTVGSFPYYKKAYGSEAIRMVKDIDVICFEKDIEYPYVKINDYSAQFTYNDQLIDCLLADKVESLQLFLQEFPEPCGELLYIMLDVHLKHPSSKWEKQKEILHYMLGSILPSKRASELIQIHTECMKQKRANTSIAAPKTESCVGHAFLHTLMKKNIENCLVTKEMSKDIWEVLPEEIKIKYIIDESYLIALEKKIIPSLVNNTPMLSDYNAFKYGLMCVCLSACSEAIRIFAFKKYYKIMDYYDRKYVTHFLKEYKNYERTQQKQATLQYDGNDQKEAPGNTHEGATGTRQYEQENNNQQPIKLYVD